VGWYEKPYCFSRSRQKSLKALNLRKTLQKSNIASESLISYKVACLGEGLNTMQDLVLSKNDLEKEIHEIHEFRVFLEKCLIIDSCDQEFIDFLEEIASIKNEDLMTLIEKLGRAYERLADFRQIIEQVEIQFNQVTSYLGKRILESGETRKKKTGSSLVKDKNELTFEEKFALEIIKGINEQLIEANTAIINFVENVWDYLPLDVQESFQRWLEIKRKTDYNKNLEKIFEGYKTSSENRDNAILNAIEKGKSLPKFRRSILPKEISNEQQQQNTREKFLKNSSDDTIYPTRRYTLEELLKKITPENTHEETNWGNAVGQEIWE
jgi:antitoxin component of MazEF toxin-antitoxin module